MTTPNLDFLNDEECRRTIARLAGEATKVWAPDEVSLTDVITDAYLEQVREAGRLLYRRKTGDANLGFSGGADPWLLFVLPVLTGFLGNLLATAGVKTWELLRDRSSKPAPAGQPALFPLTTEQIQSLLKPEAQTVGLSAAQVEQMARVLAPALTTILLVGARGGGQP